MSKTQYPALRYRPIEYRIHDRDFGSRFVNGYAVKSWIPVMFCVRKIGSHYWQCDHFETGSNISSYGATRELAAFNGALKLERAVKDGSLDMAVKQFYKIYCHGA